MLSRGLSVSRLATGDPRQAMERAGAVRPTGTQPVSAAGALAAPRHGVLALTGIVALVAFAFTLLAAAVATPPSLAQGEGKSVLLYTGTTGFRHTGAIDQGRPVVQTRLEALGFEVTWEDCNLNGGAANNCDNPDKNPRIFTDANLADYDAIVFLNASWSWAGGGLAGPLLSVPQREAVIRFVQAGGGVAAVHNSTDMGAGVSVWDWWDGGADSVIGTTMPGHSANNLNATVQVSDRNHLSTRDLPDTFQFSDEHYNWARNVRGDHHVLANFDERTYNPGPNAMGQDHPISWCKLYDGDNVPDGTGEPKPYQDGRTWNTGMGHNGARFTDNGGDNPFVNHLIGGIRWVAGEGKKSDCGATVWSNYSRTVLVPDANVPIAIDVAADGKVYWSEIGPTQGLTSEGFIKMHDPAGAPGNSTVVAAIPTRADHTNSEDGVLGMSLEPGFDLAGADTRDIYVYYSPRNDAWPGSGENDYTVGYNLISRFTLTAAGDSVVPGSEREILRVPKVKLAGNPTWCEGCPGGNGPGHVGGASLVFDSEGNLYLGVGDDVSPNESGHSGYPPLDYRATEHRDARKTSANTNDLRGKIVRVDPLEEIPAGTEPGVGATYQVPAGNMFAPGTPNTRPEIYAMGFRQPFTVHADPANPGTVTVGEYCHDNSSNGAQRAPAGVCEWDLISEPVFHGWPFCVGDNSAANSSFRWNYAGTGSTTGEPYDCSAAQIPSDLDYAPAGQANPGPTFPGAANLPGPAAQATIWKKYPGAAGGQNPADFGDLGPGGMQPITGPIYRHDADAPPGAFPAYYDGSWFINNRGGENGFWKEVRLRSDTNEMLRVHDWLPYNQFGTDGASLNSLVIGTRFGPDGALYMARFPVTCCRNNVNAGQQTQIVKIEFTVQDECLADEQAPNVNHQIAGQEHPQQPGTYINSATLSITANDVGCAGVDTIEYRLAGETEWTAYGGPIPFEAEGDHEVEYRATDRFDNVSALGTAAFSVVAIEDTEPPTVTATLEGSQDQRGLYVPAATLTVEADDGPTGSGVQSVEYRVNGGEWQAYQGPVDFDQPGAYEVDYRATDNLDNTSEPGTSSFQVISGQGCVAGSSDEFEGSELDTEMWPFVRGDEGYPVTVSGGNLNLPILDEVDGTRTGPLSFVSQQVPDGDWSAMTRVTLQHESSWQQAGLMLWQSDTNFVKGVFSRNSNTGARYFELTSDNPPNNSRQVGPSSPVDESFPTTAWIRLYRDGNTIGGEFAPDVDGEPGTWTPFASTRPVDVTPPREGDGVRVGPYAGSDIDGTWESTASFDFVRFEGDEYQCEEDAPSTSASLDPEDPGEGGTYEEPVGVTLEATDGGDQGAAGVERTEYRIVTDGVPGDWVQSANSGGDEPFVSSFTVSTPGSHVVEFRSTDNAANAEETQSVSFSVEGSSCVGARSDEFDSGALDTQRWNVRVDDPGEATIEDGQLVLPILNEIDGAGTGPLAFVSQQAPDGDWSLTTRVTPVLESSWAQAGLMLWQSDGNFVKAVFGRDSNSGVRRMELTSDNPTDQRQIGPNVVVDESFPATAWIRMYREGNTIGAEFAPDVAGEPGTWAPFGSTRPVDVDPPREGEGVQLGLFAGSDILGPPFNQTASFDFARFEPDEEVCPGDDTTPPVTTHALDPADPGEGGTYDGPVNVNLSATDPGEGGEPTDPQTHEVDAVGNAWVPDDLDIALGDDVQWNFDATQTGQPHDVWLVPPGGDPDPAGDDIFEVTDGIQFPGDPSVSHTFDQSDAWTFICKVHSTFIGGAWSGMVGTADVAEGTGGGDPGSGVDFTEYRVNTDGATGDWVQSDNTGGEDPFETFFTVAAEGQHQVEYRSTDNAGNVENIKSFEFGIAGASEPPPPPPPPSVTLLGARRKQMRARGLLRKGLRVRGNCRSVRIGTAQLVARGRAARRLGFRKRRIVLAKTRVTCGPDGRLSTLLKPRKRKVRRGLRRLRGKLRVTLVVEMSGAEREVSDRRKLILLGRRKRG